MQILSPRFPPAPGGRMMPHDTVIVFTPSNGVLFRGRIVVDSDFGSEFQVLLLPDAPFIINERERPYAASKPTA